MVADTRKGCLVVPASHWCPVFPVVPSGTCCPMWWCPVEMPSNASCLLVSAVACCPVVLTAPCPVGMLSCRWCQGPIGIPGNTHCLVLLVLTGACWCPLPAGVYNSLVPSGVCCLVVPSGACWLMLPSTPYLVGMLMPAAHCTEMPAA